MRGEGQERGDGMEGGGEGGLCVGGSGGWGLYKGGGRHGTIRSSPEP